MAESSQGGGSGNQAQPTKEMSMEMRLLLAFLLMGAVMLLTPYFLPKSPTPPPGKKTAQTVPPAAEPGAAQSPAQVPAQIPAQIAPAAAAKPGAKRGPAAAKPALAVNDPQPLYIVDTNLFRVSFSNQGGTLRSWVLKKYKGNDGKQLDLVNPSSGMEYPFSLYFPGQTGVSKLNWAWYKQTGDPDGLGVTFEYADEHQSVRKKFRFEKASYLAQISTEVTTDGKPTPNMVEWRGGFGDLTIPVPAANTATLYFDQTTNKLQEQKAGAAKSGPVTASGNFSFAGMEDKYFTAVFLGEGASTMQQTTFGDWARTELEEKPQNFAGVAVSDGDTNKFRLFVGPKDVRLLKGVDPKLEQAVDFGWLSLLAKPLFLVVDWVNTNFVHSFGWAIVLVTVVINFALFPLKLTNMKSMRKMQALKPQIDAINAKFKSVGLRDPKKAEQNQEVMDLYKKHGVNPMGGCVPMLLQVPFFIAFYKVFTVSVEMRGATWLWVTDLSQAEHLPIKILPIIMIVTQFLMQKMTPQANVDPNQQKMMYMMPLIFGFMFYQLPSGLVLYYLTSNLVNMGQQYFFNNTNTAKAAALSVEPPKKKNGRK
jgi:YidC/Oxa1 family membrane protein insertase